MANTATLEIQIVADTARAQAALNNTSGTARKLGGAMKAALAAGAVAAAAAVVKLGTASVKAASDLQQAQGAVEAVYGKAGDAVTKYAETSANRLGLAKSEYLNFSSLVGAALQNAGYSAQQAAGMSDKALTRAADLASTYGGTTAEAVEAINAAVSRAEFDPLEKYAISLNKTAINAELAARGQDDLTGAALKQAETAATLDLIYEKSAKSAGQFARESDTLAGSQARATATLKDIGATIGQYLLPVIAQLLTGFVELARVVGSSLEPVMRRLGPYLEQLFAGLDASALTGFVSSVAKLASGVQAALSRAFADTGGLSEFVAVVRATFAAIMSVVRPTVDLIVVLLESRWGQVAIANLVSSLKMLLGVIQGVFKIIRGVILIVTGVLTGDWAKAWEGVQTVVEGVMGIVGAIVTHYMGMITRAFGAVFGILGELGGKASGVVGKLLGAFAGLAVRIFQKAGNVQAAFVRWVRALPGRAKTIVGKMLRAYANLAVRVWKAAGNIATAFGRWVRDLPGKAKAIVLRILAAYAGLAARIIRQAGNVVAAYAKWWSALPGKARDIAARIATAFAGLAGKLINKAGSIASQFATWLSGLPGKASSIVSSIVNAFRGLAGKILNAIGTIDIGSLIKLPDKGSGVPYVPGLSQGGITTGPTLAMVGDNPGGREAIIPLDKYNLGGTGPITVELYMDSHLIGRFVDSRVDHAMGKQARRIQLRAAG